MFIRLESSSGFRFQRRTHLPQRVVHITFDGVEGTRDSWEIRSL